MRVNVVATMRVGALLAGVGTVLPWVMVSPTVAAKEKLTALDLANGAALWHRPELYLIPVAAGGALVLAHSVSHAIAMRLLAVAASLASLVCCALFMAQGAAVRFGDGYVSLYSGNEDLAIAPGSYICLVGCIVMAVSALLACGSDQQAQRWLDEEPV